MAALRSGPALTHPAVPLLLLLLGIPGAARGRVLQTPAFVPVSVGENLTLNCMLTGIDLRRRGSLRWYKGSQNLVYSEAGTGHRARRVVPGSFTDFSILIADIKPQDAGTYYCLKSWRVWLRRHKKWGRGTVVSVTVPTKLWLKMDPAPPIKLDDTVTITCIVEGFYRNDTSLVWQENWKKISLDMPVPVTPNLNGTFSLESSLKVTATEQRNLSVFSCTVMNNFQPLLSKSTILNITNCSCETGQWLLSNLSLWIGLLLSKTAGFIFLLYLFLKKNATQNINFPVECRQPELSHCASIGKS